MRKYVDYLGRSPWTMDEFAGRALDAWAYQVGVKLSFIRPGKPVENAYIESFNGKFRDECLNEHFVNCPSTKPPPTIFR